MRRPYVLGAALLAALSLTCCGQEKEEPAATASYIQSEYANSPDADCIARPNDFYADKAKSKVGIEELIFTACQYSVRGDFHGAKAKADPGRVGDPNSHLGKAMRCLGEVVAVTRALQQVGVTNYNCPGTVVKASK